MQGFIFFFTYFSNSNIINARRFDRCQALVCVRPYRVYDLSGSWLCGCLALMSV